MRRLCDAPAAPAPARRRRRRRRRRPARGRGGRGGGAGAAQRGAGARRRRRRRRRRRGALARYEPFEDVVALVRARRDMSLLVEIETGGAAGALRAGPDRVRARRGGAAGSRGAAGAAAAALDRRALGRGGGGLGRRGDHRRGCAPSGRATCGRGRWRIRWCRRCWRPFPGAEIRDVRPADALGRAAGAAGGRGRHDEDDWIPSTRRAE